MNNEYAFPLAFESYQSSDPPQKNNKGMTLLDFFASQAPNEIPDWFKPNLTHIEKYFKWRWYYAIEMLKERENWINNNEIKNT